MYLRSRALCVLSLLPLLFISSNAIPNPSAPSPTQTNGTSPLTSIGASSTGASSTSAISSSSSITIGSLSTSVVTTSLFSSGDPSSTQSASSFPTPSAGSGVWNYKNSLFGSTFVGTGIPPPLVNHDGQLFVMYTNRSTNDLYYATGNNDNWGTSIKFVSESGQSYPVSNTQAPALASFYENLHAVIQQNSSLIHFIFNDTTNVWIQQSVITSSYSAPTLTVYNGELFLAMVYNSGNQLGFCSWDPANGWSPIAGANGETTWGIPAMYVQDNVLYMLFAANNGDRGILNLVYNTTARSWSRSPTPPPRESTAFGVSATFGDGMSFMGFQDHRSTGTIFVSVNNGSWAPHEVPGGTSSDTPTLAILDGVLNVVFNSGNRNRDILWLQRPLTNYSLESWMSVLSDSRYISSLSIPGTHDSTAISYTPTVGCQTMTITEQLNAGIRYFDLRAGLYNNSLIMYHNFYRIDFPGFLLLTTVIQDILQWLSAHGTEAVIVQIKQDNDPISSTISFATAVSQVINQTPSVWNVGTTLPTLGALRGTIQLMRRYSVNETAGEQAIGIDVTNWPDNNPQFNITTPSGVNLVLQDEYRFDEDLETLVPDKFGVVNNLLQVANSDSDPTTWYINFASATHVLDGSGFWIMPEDIAVGAWDVVNFKFVPGVNTLLRNQIYGLPSGKRYGTVLMDFPEAPDVGLIARIVAENM